MRITAAQRAENEKRIRATMDRLLRGEVPPGGNCDVKTLATEASVDRTAFYGNRPYAHLRHEFEARLLTLHDAGTVPDPRLAQIARLKTETAALRQRLTERDETIAELAAFKTVALSRLAAQHDEIARLRATGPTSNVRRLPARAAQIGPC